MLVSVVEALGSTPREAGTTMLVTADAMSGSIGGGELEWRAIQAARELLAGEGKVLELSLPLGPALQQCCGGHVRLLLERLGTERRRQLADDAAAVHARLPLVALFGAGHVGRAIAGALEPLPCRLVWVDSRADAMPTTPPPQATLHSAADPLAVVSTLPPGTYHLVMTHSHPQDLAIVEAVLRRGDFAWLGLIGSLSKRQRFERQLRAVGLASDRLVCPIGIAGIRGKEPAVIAASVTAQLLLAFEAASSRAALAA